MSRNAINELYKKYYRRDATPEELDFHEPRFGEELDADESDILQGEMTSAPNYLDINIPDTFVNEITNLYQTKLDRDPTLEEIRFYAGEDQYGTDAISPEESARFDNAVRIEKSKDRGFDTSVVDFFRRTVDRDPTQAELLAYSSAYKQDEGDGGYSFDRQEQDIARQNLLEERQQKFGLANQIDALYKGTFGTTPDPTSYGEAEQFFQKLGEYGTDPRRITARDAQKFKEQVVMPKQLAKIPMNYANMSPTNLPTSFLAPNSPLPAVGADGLPVPTGSLPNVAITGGVAPLPTGAPTTAPKMVDVTAPVNPEEKAVGMNRGGDPVLEMMRRTESETQRRAREDLDRILGK